MSNQKIDPEKVTRPFQLLAAWLVGLIVINGTFLAAAASFNEGSWERFALTVAAIINVPIFLIAFFLLQTRFRAELQEDSFYHQYLNKKTKKVVSVRKESSQEIQLSTLATEIKTLRELLEQQGHLGKIRVDTWRGGAVAINDLLSDFSEIRSELKKNQIPLSSIFGSTNDGETLPPSRRIVSISVVMSFKDKLKLLRILSQFQLEGYQYFVPNEVDRDAAYIGAYSYEDSGECFPFNQDFRAFIKKDIERIDLDYLENKLLKAGEKKATPKKSA